MEASGEQNTRITFRSATTASLVIGFAIATCVFGTRTIAAHEAPIVDGMLTLGCGLALVASILQWTFAYVEFGGEFITRRAATGRIQSKPLSAIVSFRKEGNRAWPTNRQPLTSGYLEFSDGTSWYIPPGIADYQEFIRQVKHAVHMIEGA